MDLNDGETSLYRGGTGGKFQRRTQRKTQATPYDRPRKNSRSENGWLSKLVSPASRILKSVFSKELTSSENSDSDSEMQSEEPKEDIVIEHSDNAVFKSKEQDHSSNSDNEKTGVTGNAGGKLIDVEQLVKQKTFSREEFSRLMEIIRSRTTDFQDKENQVKETTKDMAAKSVLFEQDVHTPHVRIQGTNSMPASLMQQKTFNEVGATPVELAKAFMGSRTSTSELHSHLQNPNDEIIQSYSALKPSIFSDSSTCWPGAMLPGEAIHQPRQIRDRIEDHNFPYKPYSVSALPRYPSKDGEYAFDISADPGSRLQNLSFGFRQVTRKGGSINNEASPSITPIHRAHQKSILATPTRRFDSLHSTRTTPVVRSNVHEGNLSAHREIIDSRTSLTPFRPKGPNTPSIIPGSPHVHPRSSEVARKILEHLDRTIPTPKEKMAEIKLSTSWKNPLLTNTSDFDVSFHRIKSSNEPNISIQGREDRAKNASVFSNVTSQNSLIPIDETKEQDERISTEHCSSSIPDTFQTGKTLPHLETINKPKQEGSAPLVNSSAFSFPISAASTVVSEPAMPTLKPFSQVKEESAIPSFSFGSRNSGEKLVFCFPSSTTLSTIHDASTPKYEFRSNNKSKLSFGSIDQDTICY